MLENITDMENAIKTASKSPAFAQLKGNQKINFINQVGKKYGYEQLSTDDEDSFNHLFEYIGTLQGGITEGRFLNIGAILKESMMELPQSKSIMRYDDDIVTKTMKDIVSKEFDGVTIKSIKGDDGGQFYTMVISVGLEEGTGSDLEMKRFYVAQTMSAFRAKFFASVSAILPIVNITTDSYEFTKNSNKLTFNVTALFSNTNDRDWVTGKIKFVDEKKKEKIEKLEKAPTVKEASTGKKSVVKPIDLVTALQQYKNKQINLKILQTAIKAASRADLELFVLRHVGVNLSAMEAAQEKAEDAAEAANDALTKDNPDQDGTQDQQEGEDIF